MLMLFKFESCHNLIFWVLSQFLVFEFCHNLSFWFLSQFQFLSAGLGCGETDVPERGPHFQRWPPICHPVLYSCGLPDSSWLQCSYNPNGSCASFSHLLDLCIQFECVFHLDAQDFQGWNHLHRSPTSKFDFCRKVISSWLVKLHQITFSLVYVSQLNGHSRQGSCGVCQGISMGSETPNIPKRFYSPLTQYLFSIVKKNPSNN